MDKEKWNKLVIENSSEFLQSWQWGEFNKALGKKVVRVNEDGFLVQIIFNQLPFKLEYAYIPRGPVLISENLSTFACKDRQLGPESKVFWDSLKKIKGKNTIFFEIEPSKKINFLKTNKKEHRQPKKTLILDLSQNIENIFSSFHKKHRYGVRLAERSGVKIKKESSWESFFELSQKTAQRHNFKTWSRNYHKVLWETLEPEGMIEIWGAYVSGKLITSNLYIIFGNRVTYLFGASDYIRRSYMAPHLMHWNAIKEFKKRGFTEYDFWGLDEKKFAGVTTFKKRFGGKEISYPGPYIKTERFIWYQLYKLARKWHLKQF